MRWQYGNTQAIPESLKFGQPVRNSKMAAIMAAAMSRDPCWLGILQSHDVNLFVKKRGIYGVHTRGRAGRAFPHQTVIAVTKHVVWKESV